MRSTLLLLLLAAIPALAHLEVVEPSLHSPPSLDQLRAIPRGLRTPPSGVEIVNPGEWCRAEGVIVTWSGWEQDLIASIAEAVARDDKVFMLVRSWEEASCASYLEGAGVNMANVIFVHFNNISSGSMWVRDFGPFFLLEDGMHGVGDFRYLPYPNNDIVPQVVADHLGIPYYTSLLAHDGGNHLHDGNGTLFASTNITLYNGGWSEEEIRQEFNDYLGIDSLVIVEPMEGDFTHHIDMFVKMLSDTLFIVGHYENAEDAFENDKAILDGLAAELGRMHNLEGRPYHVERIELCPMEYGGPAGRTNKTYTNALILNDKVLVPIYNHPLDAQALARFEELMPGYEIIGLDSEFIIDYAGAIHCVTSCVHSANPLFVHHNPMLDLPMGEMPYIRFSLTPRFEQMDASVFWRSVGDVLFNEVPAVYASGVWSATLPMMEEDFEYYVSASAASGLEILPVTHPRSAPWESFAVDVWDATSVETPKALVGLRCHPNPFNPKADLSFTLRRDSRVDLNVYSSDGRLVRQLAEGLALEQGSHLMSWHGLDDSGRAQPSGLYLVVLRTEAECRVEKALLIK